jgi:hypothetical protein
MKRWAAEHMERLGFMPSWARGGRERSRIGHHNPRVAYSPSFLRIPVADGRAKRCFASASPLGRSVDTAPEFDPASLANSHGARPRIARRITARPRRTCTTSWAQSRWSWTIVKGLGVDHPTFTRHPEAHSRR